MFTIKPISGATLLACFFSCLVIIQTSNSSAQEDLSLLSLEELVNVEVTSASRKLQQVSDVAAAIHVITADDIRRSGVSSVPEALRSVPGMHVARIDDNKWAVSARGFNDLWGNKLLVLMDGRHLYTPYYAGVLWDTHSIPIDNIKRIEVIRGPGATLWGSNAVNGIINIITRSPRETQGLLVTATTNTENSYRAGIRYGGSTQGNWLYRVDVDSIKEDVTRTPLSVTDFNTWEHTRASFRLDGSPLEGHELSIDGAYYYGESKETIQPLYHSHHRGVLDLRLTQQVLETQGGWLMMDWQKRDERGAGWGIKSYLDKARRESVIYGLDQTTFSLEYEHRLLLGDSHDVVWGAGMRNAELPLSLNSDNFDVINDNEGFDVVEAFIQDEISLSDSLSLTIGTKFENSEYVGLQIQPNARVSWRLDESTSMWASISKAKRTPSRRESSLVIFPSQILPPNSTKADLPLRSHQAIRGNDTLQSEDLVAYEAGLKTTVGSNLELDLAVFENHYEKLIEATDVNFTCAPRGEDFRLQPSCIIGSDHIVRQMRLENGPGARSRGAELSLNYLVSNSWRIRTALTAIDLKTQDLDEEFLLVTQGPEWLAYVRSEWNLANNVEFDISLRAADEVERFGVDSYVTADFRLGWRAKPGLTLELVGQNLLDSGHQEHGSSLLETTPAFVESSLYFRVVWAR